MSKDIRRLSRTISRGCKDTAGWKMENRTRLLIVILLLVVSAGLMTAGVMRGELFAVFTKAIHICLECIGLG